MSNELVSVEERMAAMAKLAVSIERPSISSVGLRAGQLSLNKMPIPGNKLDCIVIASTHANLYYEGDYDPDNLTNPACYAYSESGVDMVPHASAPKPQSPNCKSCPHNQWGSATKGKGKACKNSRHLALIPADTKDVMGAELAVLKLPVTSVTNWSNYVNKVATLFGRPPLGMVTQIGTVPDPKSQFKVVFSQVKPVENELLVGIMDRSPSALSALEKVYEETEAKAAPTGKKKY